MTGVQLRNLIYRRNVANDVSGRFNASKTEAKCTFRFNKQTHMYLNHAYSLLPENAPEAVSDMQSKI